MGAILTLIQKKRGKILETTMTEDMAHIIAKVPAAETVDLAELLRSASSGRAFFGYQFYAWEEVPKDLQMDVIMRIRKRKGLPEKLPAIEDFSRFIYERR